jgi:magnesium transporter
MTIDTQYPQKDIDPKIIISPLTLDEVGSVSIIDDTQDDDDDITPIIGLSDIIIAQIIEAYDVEDLKGISACINPLSIPDRAELLQKLPQPIMKSLLRDVGHFFNADVFAELDNNFRCPVVENMQPEKIAEILSELDTDDALHLIEDLEEDLQRQIMRHLSARLRVALEQGLDYPEESAGRLMQREFVAVPQFWTVGKAIDYLREASETLPYEFSDVYVIDPLYHVQGSIPLNRLIRSKRSVRLVDITEEICNIINADMDQEDVAYIFRRNDISSAPVIDDNQRIIGVITIDDVIDVIDNEASEDLLLLGGVEQNDFHDNLWWTTYQRFRWLFINLLTAILASVVISFFDATIERLVALAVLMPIVASMGGNAGTQAMTVAVRALSMRDISAINTKRLIAKEVLVGMLNGSAFAILIGSLTCFWFHDLKLGLVIGAAMITNLFVAGLCGSGIPILLSRMGSDPAVSSSVLLTTATDIIGFMAFLGLATLFLI